MKKSILRILLFLSFLLVGIGFCASTAFYDRSPGIDNSISRVHKSELPAGITNQEIARILVQRMMDKYKLGTRGWAQWVWAYEIKEIHLDDNEGFNEGISVEIYVKPLISDFWANFWTFEVDWVDGGWTRVGYYMVIDDKEDYYELRGPFSGG
jgi:hypothetical protein